MARAATRERWARASSVMALLANIHRDPKKHAPFAPSDFDPTRERTPIPKTSDLSILKAAFLRKDKPKGKLKRCRAPETPRPAGPM